MEICRRWCVIVLAVFFTIITAKNLFAVDDLDYFPHEVGTYWEYMVRIDKPNSTDKYITRQYSAVVSEENKNGKIFSKIENRKVDSIIISAEFYDYTRFSNDGVYRILSDNTEVRRIKFPLIVGSEWETKNYSGQEQIYKVEGIESLEIAGSRFNDCLKISMTFKDDKKKNTKMYFYYAPKFGLVRDVYTEESGYKEEKLLIRTNVDDKKLELPLLKYFKTNAPKISDDKVISAIETQISKTFPFVFFIPIGERTVRDSMGAYFIDTDDKMMGKERLIYSDGKLSPTYYNFLKTCQSIGLVKIDKVKMTDMQKISNMGAEKIIIGITPKTNEAFISAGGKEKESPQYKFKSGEFRVKKVVKNIKDQDLGDGYEYRKILGIFEVYNTMLGTELLNSMQLNPRAEYKFTANVKLDPFKDEYVVVGISWANMNEDDWKTFNRFYIKSK